MFLVAGLGCGRIGFDTGGSATSDGMVDGGDLLETITLPAGWSADVWFDFSTSFTFEPYQYRDDPYFYSNRPHRIVLLEPPFPTGVLLVATHELLELRAPDVFVQHGYFQASGGPEAIWDVAFCDDFGLPGAPNGVCVGAGSVGGGDGIFRIAAGWSITLVDAFNNITDLAFDRVGAFDGVGAASLYYGTPDGLARYPNTPVHDGDHNGAFTEVLPSGDILTVVGDSTRTVFTLMRVASTTHAATPITMTTRPMPSDDQNPHAIAIVGGDTASLPGVAYLLVDGKRLVELGPSDVLADLAFTDPAGSWIWSHAVVAPPTHPLANGRTTFFLLEFDPVTERNRILRLTPP